MAMHCLQAAAQDDGWLAPISSGLNYSLQQIQTGLDTLHVPYSYGWAIIVLTIGTKILTFPFTKVQVCRSHRYHDTCPACCRIDIIKTLIMAIKIHKTAMNTTLPVFACYLLLTSRYADWPMVEECNSFQLT